VGVALVHSQRQRFAPRFAFLLAGALLAAAAVAPAALVCGPPSGFSPAWTPVFQGVDYAKARKLAPPVAVYAVRIALAAPGVEFLVTPSNGDRPRETDGQKVSAFLEEHDLQVAVNASPYGPVDDTDGGPRSIVGLAVSRGDRYSDPAKDYAAVLIGRDNRVWFNTPPIAPKGAYNAATGFFMLLEDGRNVGEADKRHPRTAVGTSQDGRYLYLMAIDGRQPAHSFGATTQETAAWIQALGAHDALNLDGGGSTAMALDDGHGGAKIVNRPIHGNVPGAERVNGNNLGVYARPLDKESPPRPPAN